MIPRPEAARRIGAGTIAAAMVALAAPAPGQVVERHLPPAPATAPPSLVAPPIAAVTDDRPLGPRLTGIVLLGPRQSADEAAAAGIRIGDVAPPGSRSLVHSLSRLLGRPLSRRLIARAQAAVILHYRRAGQPFLSVTTPEQALTGGVLRLRIVPYTAGRLTVRAQTLADADRIERRVRFPAGQPIDGAALQQDLGWLDHDPFRRADAVFSPGDTFGASDLTISVAQQRPWQVFGGIATSDAPASGDVRLFAGAVVGDVLGRGSVASAQLTTSGVDQPRYLSVAGRVTRPIGVRREVSLLLAYVRGRTAFAPFASLSRSGQASLALRFALPAVLIGDAHVGIDAGRQLVSASFGGERIYRNAATTFSAFVRYTAAWPVRGGNVSVDIALHVSPGGIGGDNAADRLFFGRPRAGSARYAYLTADASILRRLDQGLLWRGAMTMQASRAPLPALDQVGIGGSGYVRGYTLDDGGYDAAVIMRNGLHIASAGSLRRAAPFAFSDWGVGRLVGLRRRAIGAVGLGIDAALADRVQWRAEAALPLLDGARTRAFHPRLHGRISLSF